MDDASSWSGFVIWITLYSEDIMCALTYQLIVMMVSQISGYDGLSQRYKLKLSGAKKFFFKMKKSFSILRGEVNQGFKPLY